MGSCFVVQVLLSLVLTAVCLIWNEPLLLLFGASENTIPYATQYINVYALGTIFVQVTLGMNAYITAQGFTVVGMKTVLIGAILNTVLDPIFIFAFGMGVRGAALATILSQAVSAVWVLKFLTGSKTKWHLRREHLRPQAKVVLPALALACMATFAFADEGQAAQHVADGMPVVADHVDHMGVLPGTLVARNDNGRHEGWYKDKPRPKGHYKKGPPPGPRPGYHRPGDRPGPRPGYHRPGDRPGPRPGYHRPGPRPDGPRPGYHRPGDRPGPRPGIHDGRGPRHDGPRPGPRPGGPRPDHRPDGPRPR